MKIHNWKNAISSSFVFIIMGVMVLGLVAGSVALGPNTGRTTSQVSMNRSSSVSPQHSSVYSASSTSTMAPSTSHTTTSESTKTVTSRTATPSLVLTPSLGPPGTQFTFTFSGGKAATQYYEQSFYEQNISFTTNSRGSFKGSITVPLLAEHHPYAVKINGSNHNLVAEAIFTVTTTTTTSTTTTSSAISASSSIISSSSSASKITASITTMTMSTTIVPTSTILGSLPLALLALIPLSAVFQWKNVITQESNVSSPRPLFR